jgi:uncharacterized protein (TIGR02391 family)
MSPRPPAFTAAQLESLCRCLADTDSGLTGTEIGHFLRQVKTADPDPTMTKWRRLYNALSARQNKDRHGGRTLAFIHASVDPARYSGKHTVFERRRQEINVSLAFVGLEYRPDGRFQAVSKATTLSEAEQRANRLRAQLSARGVHPDVLHACRAELLSNNCFHAVLEASKSVAAKIRTRTGLVTDGAELVDAALGGPQPRLRINALSTDTERNEQRGFVNLAKGLFGTFRNPTAHAPRLVWNLSEEDALDLFSLASYVHRRIDAATLSP